MNKEDFVNNLLLRFSNSWNRDNFKILKNDYMYVLDNPKTDFDKLTDWILKDYSENFIPPPALIKEIANKKLLRNSKEKHIQPIIFDPRYKISRTNDCFPDGTTENQIIKTYEKMFGFIGEWKILGYV